ncbi:F-box protein [Ananas comosus]|uniref:F-box protein n=1 Tax=Ananas comosus TaxID=4615 RepID=A0A199VFI0_ANACO|nr:F-box protein [Ananas comosus]
MEGASHIGDDMLAEILAKLPLKPLFRFKCVSKSWRGLISENHLRRRLPLLTSGVFYCSGPGPHNGPRYAFASDDGGLEECDLDFFPFLRSSTLVDSCNGLLLFYAAHPAAFYVANPITRRWRALPRPQGRTRLSILAFDPSASPDYKVICFTGWRPRGADIETFSSETGEWAPGELNWPGVETDAMLATMHCFGGALYILAHSGCVIPVDLATMECRAAIGLPEPMSPDGRLGNRGGSLYYSHTSDHDHELKIWTLGQNCTWVMRCSVSVSEIGLGLDSDRAQVLGFDPERGVVYMWVGGKLVGFDYERRGVFKEWEFEKERERERPHLIQIWVFPFSNYLSNCLS